MKCIKSQRKYVEYGSDCKIDASFHIQYSKSFDKMAN